MPSSIIPAVGIATEPATDVAREAWELLFQVAKAKHGVLSARLAELDLTPVQAHALRRLEEAHARGLVGRTPGTEDRRVKTLVLTPEGARVRERVIDLLSEPPAVLARLSEREQLELRDILRRALAEDAT